MFDLLLGKATFFSLLDYVTQTDFFQIGDRKK